MLSWTVPCVYLMQWLHLHCRPLKPSFNKRSLVFQCNLLSSVAIGTLHSFVCGSEKLNYYTHSLRDQVGMIVNIMIPVFWQIIWLTLTTDPSVFWHVHSMLSTVIYIWCSCTDLLYFWCIYFFWHKYLLPEPFFHYPWFDASILANYSVSKLWSPLSIRMWKCDKIYGVRKCVFTLKNNSFA